MGKHSAAVARSAPPATTVTPTAPHTHVAATPRNAVPRVLAQTAAFGALAIVVAVIALTWAGVDHRVVASVALGLVLVGAIGFIVVQHSGLLHGDAPVDERPAGSAPPL